MTCLARIRPTGNLWHARLAAPNPCLSFTSIRRSCRNCRLFATYITHATAEFVETYRLEADFALRIRDHLLPLEASDAV